MKAFWAFAAVAVPISAQATALQAQAVSDHQANAADVAPKPSVTCAAPGDEVVVCGTRDSSHRVPLERDGFDPAGDVPSVSRERRALFEHGEAGIHSCSPVGPGGATGCAFKRWKDGYEQRAGIKPDEQGGFKVRGSVRFGITRP